MPINDALVFVTMDGYAINGSWFTKHFQALPRRAGLPKMRLHDMRHGAHPCWSEQVRIRGSHRNFSGTPPAAR